MAVTFPAVGSKGHGTRIQAPLLEERCMENSSGIAGTLSAVFTAGNIRPSAERTISPASLLLYHCYFPCTCLPAVALELVCRRPLNPLSAGNVTAIARHHDHRRVICYLPHLRSYQLLLITFKQFQFQAESTSC